jgi:hypothetical protein
VVVVRHTLGIVDSKSFSFTEGIGGCIEFSDFCLGQFWCFSFCNLQKPSIESGKTIIESRNFEPHQLNQSLIEAMASSRG